VMFTICRSVATGKYTTDKQILSYTLCASKTSNASWFGADIEENGFFEPR